MRIDPVKIYENVGGCAFSDVTANSPEIAGMLADHTFSAAFGDYDLDGDLDMFLTHWGTPDSRYGLAEGQIEPPEPSEHLWQNVSDDSGIRFVNVSGPTGVTSELFSTRAQPDVLGQPQVYDYTFTPTFARMDGDVWPDIAIASDFGTSLLLINGAGQTFSEVFSSVLRHAEFGMGSALGDYDDDGDLDWFVTSIFRYSDADTPEGPIVTPGNRFFENEESSGVINMIDRTGLLGVAQGGWGWAACFLDIDNDGDLDLYHTNGWIDQEIYGGNYSADLGRVFVSDGTVFAEDAQSFGLDDDYSGRGVVCADFDNDGDTDILELTDRQAGSGILWDNLTAAGNSNSLRVRLHGAAPNTEAAGARIYVTIGGKTQMREVTIGSNYISQNPTVQIFGLGPEQVADEVRVAWPARMPGPVQPDDWVRTAVPATANRQTLEITQN
jgi:hypothetical protein